ncbi:uncharacterized protein LOC144745892 [Ciona intestinalis]
MTMDIAAFSVPNQLVGEFKAPLDIQKSTAEKLDSSDSSISPGKKFQRRKKCRRSKKGKFAPYSAKHFLGRPKINAPANTTQFLFDDKDIGLNQLFDSNQRHSDESTNSDCDSGNDNRNQVHTQSNDSVDDMFNYEGSCGYDDSCDRFLLQDFDRMYDDTRAEMLRNESVDELTSRCMDLESAIHNMNYLHQKEVERRRKMEQIMFLKHQNEELKKENETLRETT